MAIHKDSIVDVDLTSGTIHRSFLNHSIGMNDSDGDFFGVRVFKSGVPVDLTNVSVQGHFNPPVGAPIFLNAGNYISGNVATVRLPQACYNYEGPFSLAIKLVTVNETVTVRIVDGMVDNTYVEGSVAPTGTVPTYQEVLAEYDQMVAATATANTAAQTAVNTANAAATTAVNTANAAAANCAAIVAAPYSNSATYAVGTYCTKDGKLYECTTAITTAEEWTAGHWTETKVGPEVSDLKSALTSKDKADKLVFDGGNAIDMEAITTGYRIQVSSGNPVSNSSYFVTDYIPVRPGMHFRINHTFDSSSYGTAFYDGTKTFISGSGKGATIYDMVVPDGAAYARTTFKNSETDAAVYVTYEKLDDLPEMKETDKMIREPIVLPMEQGSINTSGAGTSSDTRIRSSGFYKVTKLPLYFHVRSGFKVGYRLYSSDSASSFLSYGGFFEEDTFVPAALNQYIRIIVAKTGDANIQPAEITGYYPLCVLNLDTDIQKKFTAPNTEAVRYNIDSICGFIEEVTGIKNYIWNIGFIPTTNVSVNKDDVRYNSDYRYCVIPCSAGDSFFINSVNCPSDRRPYTFIDDEGNVLAQRQRGSAQSMTITAPADTAYLVCNSAKRLNGEWSCKLHTLSEDINTEGDQETLNKIQQLARPRRVSRVLQTPPLLLLHFSDIHADVINLGRVMSFYGQHSSYIHDVIHTGDNVDDEYSDGFSWWDTVEGSEKILNLIGNHDSNEKSGGNNNWYAISEQDDYDTFIAPYVSNWGVTYTSGHCYYYKDYTTNNVRLICLDAMHLTEDQLTWFTGVLESAKTAGLHVLVANHMREHFPETPFETNFNDTFLTSTASPSYSSSYKEYMPPEYSDAVQDFIDGGGNFVAWICGHIHYDLFAKIDRHPNQVQIGVSLGGIAYANTSAGARVRNTKSQDLFNVMAVDTYSKIVKIVRIGADYNLMMQHKDTLCYNYDTGTLIV